MPKINAFKGFRPAANLVLQVIAKPFESFYTEKAKVILQNNPISFLHTIEPLIDNPYQRGSREELVFKKAKEHFEDFIEDDILIEDSNPCIYIYRTFNKGNWQTGIWCVTAIDDYLDNTLRKHEHTRADREKDLIEYLDNTGIDANPVLVTYAGNARIQNIIDQTLNQIPIADFFADDQQHQLWKIDSQDQINILIKEFENLECSYIADGHHRAAAASLAGIQRRKNNLKHRGNEEYNFFSTLYFSFDQLQVFEFQRVLKDLNGLSTEDFLEKLKENFEVQKSQKGKPNQRHLFQLYVEKSWYELIPHHQLINTIEPVDHLDVSILQKHILFPLLGIEDPRKDKRIAFVGGLVPIDDIIQMVDSGEMKAAFFLFPTSIDELVEVANSGSVMPPKSTWFEPKLHCGLVVHRVN